MRNTYYILFFLAFQVSFSQVENGEVSSIKSILFETKIDKTKLVLNKKAKNLFPKIIKLDLKNIKNNSEGKFTLNDVKKKYFLVDENSSTSSLFVENTNIQKNKLKPNLTTNLKNKLVNSIIREKMLEELKNYMLINEALTYGDRNIAYYKNYNDIENKLIIYSPINSEIEVQLGKDIYPYLNKILKTELDKTLQNSLNLFALNF